MATIRNLTIDQGSTFSVSIELSDALGNPLDLSDYVARAQMRKSYGSNSFTEFSVSISDNPAAGGISLALTSEQTRTLRPGRYVYDIEIENEEEGVKRILEGIVTVTPEVTR
jgi:hypothetical protein